MLLNYQVYLQQITSTVVLALTKINVANRKHKTSWGGGTNCHVGNMLIMQRARVLMPMCQPNDENS